MRSLIIYCYFFIFKNGQAEAPKKKPTKSLYAKATDTGINPEVVAKRLKTDWDSAAEIEDVDTDDETEVPPVLVSSLPALQIIFVVWLCLVSHHDYCYLDHDTVIMIKEFGAAINLYRISRLVLVCACTFFI